MRAVPRGGCEPAGANLSQNRVVAERATSSSRGSKRPAISLRLARCCLIGNEPILRSSRAAGACRQPRLSPTLVEAFAAPLFPRFRLVADPALELIVELLAADD